MTLLKNALLNTSFYIIKMLRVDKTHEKWYYSNVALNLSINGMYMVKKVYLNE